MNYTAALDHLHALGQELAPGTRRKWDLAHMRTLAHALGDPQATFPAVLIAGTNGKGSTAATLASILSAAGYRTALYTSPHLLRVNERIQIDRTEIPDTDFARLFFHVTGTAERLVHEAALPHPPSFFEVLTAVAFLYFAERHIAVAILEVGLGGRLDATNIVDPLLSILTDIALDHQEFLGSTIAAIAREKCGILRPHGTLITLPQHPEANQTIGEAAAALDLHAISATPFLPTGPPLPPAPLPGLTPNHYTLTVAGEPLEVDSPLPGRHQQRNLALAIAAAIELRTPTNPFTSPPTSSSRPEPGTASTSAAEWRGPHISPASPIRSLNSYNNHATSNRIGYNIQNSAIEAGIRATHWPGRLELLHLEDGPDLLLDVAHNPAGAWTLRAAVAQLPETRPRTLIFSCLRDKSLEEMTRILFPLFDSSPDADPARRHDHIILAPIANSRATPVADLLAAAHALSIPAHAAPHTAAALAQARAVTPPGGLILATGSVYLIGELRGLATISDS